VNRSPGRIRRMERFNWFNVSWYRAEFIVSPLGRKSNMRTLWISQKIEIITFPKLVWNITVTTFKLNYPSSSTRIAQDRFFVNIPQSSAYHQFILLLPSYAFNYYQLNYCFCLKPSSVQAVSSPRGLGHVVVGILCVLDLINVGSIPIATVGASKRLSSDM